MLEWLRGDPRDPGFPATAAPAELRRAHDAIAQRFLQRIAGAGFAFELVAGGLDGLAGYEVRWTHQGSTFVGFKQPPREETAEDALLAGCAALLENQWCRERLPH